MILIGVILRCSYIQSGMTYHLYCSVISRVHNRTLAIGYMCTVKYSINVFLISLSDYAIIKGGASRAPVHVAYKERNVYCIWYAG